MKIVQILIKKKVPSVNSEVLIHLKNIENPDAVKSCSAILLLKTEILIPNIIYMSSFSSYFL